MTKYILQAAGIPQVPYVPVLKNAWKENPKKIFDQCEGSLLYPMFVKPANMGSSVGISKAENREELQNALQEAYRYDTRAIVEQGIEAREIEVAVLGNEDVRTTMPGEIVKDVAFYDYNSKYIDNRIEMQIPAQIPEETQAKAQEFAKKAYTMLGGSGLSRCDFFLTNKNELFLNELNTMPGFTEFSMYPLLWEKTTVSVTGITRMSCGGSIVGWLHSVAIAPLSLACWANSWPSRVPAKGTKRLFSLIRRLSNSTEASGVSFSIC